MTRKSDDPLADYFARSRIDKVQFRAGREFQRHFGMAKKGQQVPDHGIVMREAEQPGTDDQSSAGKWLTKCYRELGQDGSALVHDVLINARTTKQIAESRGKAGPQDQIYYARRLFECLHALARVYGFSGEERKVRAVTTSPAPSPASP